MPLKITSRGHLLLSLMENVISDLSFIKSIELCVFSQFSVISSWGSGTKPPHYPAIRTVSPPPVRNANPYGNRKICLQHLGKVSYNSPPHTLPVQLQMNRVSLTQLSLPEWFNCWRMRVNGRGTLQISAAGKRSGWLRLFCWNLRASLPQLYLHVAAFTSPQHFALKGRLYYISDCLQVYVNMCFFAIGYSIMGEKGECKFTVIRFFCRIIIFEM